MPTYDYVCQGCGHAFEHFQSMTSDVLKTCPQCKKDELKRLIGAGGALIFKGSGFYITDYKKGSSSGGATGGGDKTKVDEGKLDAQVERTKDAAKHVKETTSSAPSSGSTSSSSGSGT